MPEMKGWPKKDADNILYFEIILMVLFLAMNTTDSLLQQAEVATYIKAGSFPISQFFTPMFYGFSIDSLIIFERTFWWLHIIGILIFLNYTERTNLITILLSFLLTNELTNERMYERASERERERASEGASE